MRELHVSILQLQYLSQATFAASAVPAPTSPTATDAANVKAAPATALTSSPTRKIKGKSIDRYISIWYENTDYNMPARDRSNARFQFFAKKGDHVDLELRCHPPFRAQLHGSCGRASLAAKDAASPAFLLTVPVYPPTSTP